MEYTSIVISAVIFFFSLSLLVMAWSKKPTKKHIEELEEAGAEIAKQIQEATEESIKKIEIKMQELEETFEKVEEKYRQVMINERDNQMQRLKEEKKEIKEHVLPKVELKDEKAKQIYELYQKGYSINQISKELNMYMGVIQVYINMFKMNNVV